MVCAVDYLTRLTPCTSEQTRICFCHPVVIELYASKLFIMKPSTAPSIFKRAALPWLRPVYTTPAIRLGNGCGPLSSRALGQLTIPAEASSRSRVPLHSSANYFLHHTFLSRNLASSSTAVLTLKKTQLHDLHIAHKARMSPFAGFSMPLVYSDMSHTESHNWTRNKASLFDVSHMYVLLPELM